MKYPCALKKESQSRLALLAQESLAACIYHREVTTLFADIVSCIASRELEDDAMVNFRMDGRAVGRLWTSSIAIGRQHGLTIQVYGETGGLR